VGAPHTEAWALELRLAEVSDRAVVFFQQHARYRFHLLLFVFPINIVQSGTSLQVLPVFPEPPGPPSRLSVPTIHPLWMHHRGYVTLLRIACQGGQQPDAYPPTRLAKIEADKRAVCFEVLQQGPAPSL
jgi:hypothetical protein